MICIFMRSIIIYSNDIMKKNKLYIDIATRIAAESYCERKKVGAVIVKSDNIVSFGYNGTISGFPNVCENTLGKTNDFVLHAESNALMKCLKEGGCTKGATLFVTLAPCLECAKLIIQSGITTVVYLEDYRCCSGIRLLNDSNINVINYEKPTN